MLSPSSGNTVIKSKLISRRMFLLTAAKAVVTFGIIGRLVSLQINERTKYKTLSDKNRFNLENSDQVILSETIIGSQGFCLDIIFFK